MRAALLGIIALSLACGDDSMTVPDAGLDAGDATVGDGGFDGGEDAGEDAAMDDVGPDDVGADTFDGGPMCIDVTTLQGMYSTSLDGTCDNIIDFADQMIDPTVGGGACDVTFSSIMAKGMLGINGDVTVDADGNFAATEIMINAMPQECTGAWDASSGTMTLTCPDCTITLVRDTAG